MMPNFLTHMNDIELNRYMDAVCARGEGIGREEAKREMGAVLDRMWEAARPNIILPIWEPFRIHSMVHEDHQRIATIMLDKDQLLAIRRVLCGMGD